MRAKIRVLGTALGTGARLGLGRSVGHHSFASSHASLYLAGEPAEGV